MDMIETSYSWYVRPTDLANALAALNLTPFVVVFQQVVTGPAKQVKLTIRRRLTAFGPHQLDGLQKVLLELYGTVMPNKN